MFLTTWDKRYVCLCAQAHTSVSKHHCVSSSGSVWVWFGENEIFLIPMGAQEHVSLYVCVL